MSHKEKLDATRAAAAARVPADKRAIMPRVLDAAPCDLGGSASGVNNAAARLGGLVAVAALGSAFGGTSASDVASVAAAEAYRRVMWTAAALAVAAALMALVWLGNERPERRRAN